MTTYGTNDFSETTCAGEIPSELVVSAGFRYKLPRQDRCCVCGVGVSPEDGLSMTVSLVWRGNRWWPSRGPGNCTARICIECLKEVVI